MRLHLLNGDVEGAERATGDTTGKPAPLKLITIPYARYTVVVFLGNIELEMARGNQEQALVLVDTLIREAAHLTQPDMPEILRVKGQILLACGRMDEAAETLREACTRAEEMNAQHHLWPALALLSAVEMKLGNEQQTRAQRVQARGIVEQIGEGLTVEMRAAFRRQSRVKELFAE